MRTVAQIVASINAACTVCRLPAMSSRLLPQLLRRILDACWQQEPEQRPTADEVLMMVEDSEEWDHLMWDLPMLL